MYLDTMQQILSSTSKVVLDTKQGANLTYLPIDKILENNISEGIVGETTNYADNDDQQLPTTIPNTQANDSERSRDDNRARSSIIGRY